VGRNRVFSSLLEESNKEISVTSGL
jgi:hypothetical protein